MIAPSRATGIDAIDGPFGDFKNDHAHLKQATYAATLGAVGKWCIHAGDRVGSPGRAPRPRSSGDGQGRRVGEDARQVADRRHGCFAAPRH